MKWDVVWGNRSVGWCELQEDGLYWQLHCRCEIVSSSVERLYWNGRCLGVLEQQEKELVLQRRFSKVSVPDLPHKYRLPTLEPEEVWQGRVLDCQVPSCIKTWKEYGAVLSFPFFETEPCPCLPLLCFFEVKDNLWLLRLNEEGQPFFD